MGKVLFYNLNNNAELKNITNLFVKTGLKVSNPLLMFNYYKD